MISSYNRNLIRQVLDGQTLQARNSLQESWSDLPDSKDAVRYLIEADHSPFYCRTKPLAVTAVEAMQALETLGFGLPSEAYRTLRQFIEKNP